MNPQDQQPNPSVGPEPTQPVMPPVTQPQTMTPPVTLAPAPVSAPPVNVPGQPANPGQGLSIAGFCVAIASALLNIFTFGLLALVGLGLSIAGRVQSKKGGKPSGLALAGIIISSIVGVITLAFFMLSVFAGVQTAAQLNAKCRDLGVGVHQIDWNGTATTLTCTNSGFEITTD